jgi:hypothetical protein
MKKDKNRLHFSYPFLALNDLPTLPFEKKIKLLDDAGKTCTGELIDLLLAQRHEKRQKTCRIFRKQNPVRGFK